MKDVEVHWGLGLALLLSLLLYILLVKAFPAREGPAAQSSSMPAAAAAVVPPVVPGLPLLGSALALGSGGAAFLETCRKKVGWCKVQGRLRCSTKPPLLAGVQGRRRCPALSSHSCVSPTEAHAF
jgi:hypothetical protein